MDRKTVGILGVVAGLATVTPGLVQPASASDALKASSYADLLEPVTNAVELLHAQDMRRQDTRSESDQSPRYQPAYYYRRHHHHHHHHHHHRRHY